MKKSDLKISSRETSADVVSTILGILACASILFSPVFSLVLGVIGIIFNVSQKEKQKNNWRVAGFFLNLISIIVSLLVMITFILLQSKYGGLI